MNFFGGVVNGVYDLFSVETKSNKPQIALK
jgi:hypothetical protein